MKKRTITAVLAASISLAAGFAAFAGQWENDGAGRWYNYGNGSYPADTWEWIDSDHDGKAECYRFDASGYLFQGTVTPDGYQVNEDGAWVEGGAVQTKAVGASGQAAPSLPADVMAAYQAYQEYPRDSENSYVIAAFSTKNPEDGSAPSQIIDHGDYYEVTNGYIFGPYIIPDELLATPIAGMVFTLYLSDQNKNVSSATFMVNESGYFDYLDSNGEKLLENCYVRDNKMHGPADWGLIYDKIYHGSLYFSKDCQVISDYSITFQEYITQYQEYGRFEYGRKKSCTEDGADNISGEGFPVFDSGTGMIVRLHEYAGV